MESLTSIAGLAAAIITIVSIWVHAAPEKRLELGRTLLTLMIGVFVVGVICFSAYQITAFRYSTAPLTRPAVVDLLIHVFNLVMWTNFALDRLAEALRKHRAAVRQGARKI